MRCHVEVFFADDYQNRLDAAHHVARAGDVSLSAISHVLGYHDTGNEIHPSRQAALFFHNGVGRSGMIPGMYRCIHHQRSQSQFPAVHRARPRTNDN